MALQPNNTDAEMAVIAAVIDNPRINVDLIGAISPEDFYSPAHQIYWGVLRDLDRTGKPIDDVTVRAALVKSERLEKTGGDSYLVELMARHVTSANTSHHAEIVKGLAVTRRVIELGATMQRRGEAGEDYYTVIGESRQALDNLLTSGGVEVFDGKASAKEAFERLEYRCKHQGEVWGIQTGFKEIDEKTGGLHAGELVIIAGRPSMGKSAFAQKIAQNAAIRGNVPTAFFSIEMTRANVQDRLLSSESKTEAVKIRTGRPSDGDWPRLAKTGGEWSKAPLFIIEKKPSLHMVRSVTRDLKARHGLQLVIVDYLQIMIGNNPKNREREIAELSAGLKDLAKEESIVVVALSQLNRVSEARQNKRPMLGELRESGAIEQDADVVFLVYRDEYYNPTDTKGPGIAEITIAKQRNGSTDGIINLRFVGRHMNFEDPEEGKW
jgi:replicative DNA helicase